MTKLLSFLSTTVLFATLCYAQEKKLHYNLMWNNKKVGTLLATQNINNNTQTYTLEAEVNMKVLLSYHVESYTNCTFSNNKLVKSHSKYVVNNKVKENNTVTHTPPNYQCDNCKTKTINQAAIHFSVAKLYFYEPEKPGRIFCERFGEYGTLTKEHEHEYKLTLPDGNSNRYIYENGILTKVSVDRGLYSMAFVLEQ